MNDFQYYRAMPVDQLIEDAGFREWVLNPDEAGDAYWRAFLEAYPGQQEVVAEARAFLLATRSYFGTADKSAEDIEQSLQQVLLRAGSGVSEKTLARERKIRPSFYRLSIAASIGLLLVFSLLLLLRQKQPLVYQTAYGEWKEVVLPDGSVVQLNANSTLKIGEDWTEGALRKVWLTGEAFFEVEKKPATQTKFQVITGDLIIEVLGTQFNVQDRGQQTEIFLKEGKIRLALPDTTEYLQPGDYITYSPERKAIVSRSNTQEDTHTSWKDGTLLMNDAVSEILREIEQIYGVKMVVRDSSMLQEVRKVGVPMKDLETVIPILEISLNINVTQDGNKLILQ